MLSEINEQKSGRQCEGARQVPGHFVTHSNPSAFTLFLDRCQRALLTCSVCWVAALKVGAGGLDGAWDSDSGRRQDGQGKSGSGKRVRSCEMLQPEGEDIWRREGEDFPGE